MSASNAKERDEWMQCINDSIRENPLHDFVAAKKAEEQAAGAGIWSDVPHTK